METKYICSLDLSSFVNKLSFYAHVRKGGGGGLINKGETPGGGGWGGGDLIFSSDVGSGPASTVQPQNISGISSTPKNI